MGNGGRKRERKREGAKGGRAEAQGGGEKRAMKKRKIRIIKT